MLELSLLWLALIAQGTVPEAAEVLPNPTFANFAAGWQLHGAHAENDGGRNGLPSVALVAPKNGQSSHVGVVVEAPPLGRMLRFRCAVQATIKRQQVTVRAMAYSQDQKLVGRWIQEFSAGANDWTDVETSYVLDVDAAALDIRVMNLGPGDLLACDASLQPGEPAQAEIMDLGGCGIIRATARTYVGPREAGDAGIVTFPIPGTYREQIPLLFEVLAEPAEAIQSFRWRLREDGVNWLCEVKVAPPASGAVVRWEALVLVNDAAPLELPLAPEPQFPEEVSAWLASTACVQSDDPDVEAKARELAESAPDVGSYASAVVQFTLENRGDGAPFRTLDAASALHCGGSCTSRANLGAALLRANGIPARTMAHLPTWSGPLYEHWLVEYWHPGVGWVWLETSLGVVQPRPYTLVTLNVANPADEDLSFEPSMSHSGVMLGAPELAVHKHSQELIRAVALRGENPGNEAIGVLRLRDLPDDERAAIFAEARAAYETLRDRCLAGAADPERTAAIRAAADAGSVKRLRDALRRSGHR